MSAAGRRADVTVSVRADLMMDLDGASVTLTGDGDRLVLATERPLALWETLARTPLPVGVGSVSGPAGAGRVADALRDAGVNLDVRGPRGTVASLGAGVDSALGRVLAGSSALRPGGLAAVAPLMWHAVRHHPAARIAGLALATIVGVVVGRRAHRR